MTARGPSIEAGLEPEPAYTAEDVAMAEQRIRAECPTAIISKTDYDWSLSVARSDKTQAFIVYRHERVRSDGSMQLQVIGDLDRIIAAINAPAKKEESCLDP